RRTGRRPRRRRGLAGGHRGGLRFAHGPIPSPRRPHAGRTGRAPRAKRRVDHDSGGGRAQPEVDQPADPARLPHVRLGRQRGGRERGGGAGGWGGGGGGGEWGKAGRGGAVMRGSLASNRSTSSSRSASRPSGEARGRPRRPTSECSTRSAGSSLAREKPRSAV